MAAACVQTAMAERAPGSSLQNSFTLTLLSDIRISSFPNRSLQGMKASTRGFWLEGLMAVGIR